MSLSQNFADGYNAGNLETWAACFAEDAKSQVLDSPFPTEQGREVIKNTSCKHMLGEGDKPHALTAKVVSDEGVDVVVFLQTDETKLDCIAIVEGDELVKDCKYRVWWHSEDWLNEFAARHGLSRPD
ncbi:MAG: nuclear transport factor 2-like protein [Planctomycetota bacterium]|jgi:hypothetical protein